MEGLLLVDKPAGWTSFDVVKYVRRMVANMEGVPSKRVKVGHSGTLDPFATGLLIVLIGKKYTRQAETLLKKDKLYSVMMILDMSSTTGDSDGELTQTIEDKDPPRPGEVESALNGFLGESWQTPPIFSAIKVNGVRAYKLARENKPVELEPRRVNIKRIKLLDYDYPRISFEVEVSSGTYIRSLVEDIAKKLDRTAYTKELRRLTNGIYSVEDAVLPERLNEQTIGSRLIKTDE